MGSIFPVSHDEPSKSSPPTPDEVVDRVLRRVEISKASTPNLHAAFVDLRLSLHRSSKQGQNFYAHEANLYMGTDDAEPERPLGTRELQGIEWDGTSQH